MTFFHHTTIKRTSEGDAAYAMSYAAAGACIQRLAAGRGTGIGLQHIGLQHVESDVGRVELFRLTLRFFDDASTTSQFIFSIPNLGTKPLVLYTFK